MLFSGILGPNQYSQPPKRDEERTMRHSMGSIRYLGAVAIFAGTAVANNLQPASLNCADLRGSGGEGIATLSDFLALGSSTCSVGPLIFGNFQFSASATSGAPLALPGNLTVFTSWDPSSQLATLQLQGFTPYSVSDLQSALYRFQFAVDPAPILEGEDVTIDPPFGVVSGEQLFCTNSFLSDCPQQSLRRGVFGIGTPFSVRFSPPLALLDLDTRITLNPGLNTASGLDGLVFDFHVADPIPEPGTWMLVGAGLAVATAFRKRRR